MHCFWAPLVLREKGRKEYIISSFAFLAVQIKNENCGLEK